MDTKIDDFLITKNVIYSGKIFVPLKPGTRVKFHFRTTRCDNGKLIDDSKEMGTPMELVLGKKFKLEVWEVMVSKMSLDELAKFVVDKSLVKAYPFVSKTLRDIGKKIPERRHCCAMTLQNDGLGYKDLDELLTHPTDLEFIIDLFSIEMPHEYEKERWQMTDDEKLIAITTLRQKGNEHYKRQEIAEAETTYQKALGIVEQLMLKEKPRDVEWLELAALKVPLLLNFSQCRLLAKDYYTVIDYCNQVLDLEPNNVKALFRRAKAHLGAWNPVEARQDFQAAAELDPALQAVAAKELCAIEKEQRLRDEQDKLRLQKLF